MPCGPEQGRALLIPALPNRPGLEPPRQPRSLPWRFPPPRSHYRHYPRGLLFGVTAVPPEPRSSSGSIAPRRAAQDGTGGSDTSPAQCPDPPRRPTLPDLGQFVQIHSGHAARIFRQRGFPRADCGSLCLPCPRRAARLLQTELERRLRMRRDGAAQPACPAPGGERSARGAPSQPCPCRCGVRASGEGRAGGLKGGEGR